MAPAIQCDVNAFHPLSVRRGGLGGQTKSGRDFGGRGER